MKLLVRVLAIAAIALAVVDVGQSVATGNNKLDQEAHPPFHLGRVQNFSTPSGLSPQTVRLAYNLPATGGAGTTVAIVDAYDNPNAAADLQAFNTQFGLPSTTFTKVKMASKLSTNSGWILEESMDVQWAHALAPNANILLVEARSSRLSDLLAAVDYARKQPGVVSVSMSWGSSEFSGSQTYDTYFASQNGLPISFFASSGDSGTGVQWPAVSQNVTGVGGTTLTMSGSTVSTESAWNGSGGGVSQYVSEPLFQSTLVTNSNNMRSVPDVSFDADPATGVSVYDSYGYNGQRGWFQVGGTSLGAPSWAAINALGHSSTNVNFYTDAVSGYATHFRDVTTGNNGTCGTVCTAATGYDFVTGLGSPLTVSY